jgi:hypothetical protein
MHVISDGDASFLVDSSCPLKLKENNNESWIHWSVEGCVDVFTLALVNERCHEFTWHESVSERLLGVAALTPVRLLLDIVTDTLLGANRQDLL